MPSPTSTTPDLTEMYMLLLGGTHEDFLDICSVGTKEEIAKDFEQAVVDNDGNDYCMVRIVKACINGPDRLDVVDNGDEE